jgi:NADH-quinone oxidoreductase subunit F
MTTLTPVLTRNWGEADSFTYDGYRRGGGYEAVRGALTTDPDALIQAVKDSRLRGRGGAGFPTGMKWGFIPQGDGKAHYLVVNAAESQPGPCTAIPPRMAPPHALV